MGDSLAKCFDLGSPTTKPHQFHRSNHAWHKFDANRRLMTTPTPEPWRRAQLPPGASLRDAIQVLNDAALRIALVVDPAGILVGTLTDGDIRRGLLRGLDLQSPIDGIIRRDAFVVPAGLGPETIAHLMRTNKLLQLPVVDAERRLLGLHLWDEFCELTPPGARPHLMVIMAGGQGTRLRPHTEHCPKPLLPIAGKPMLQHILERARDEGFGHFVFAINYLGQMIEDHFADGASWRVRIDYLREAAPLGTAGALALLDPRPDQPFLVTNGDVLTDIQYGALLDFHCRHGSAATMAVRQQEWQSPYGVVRTRGLELVGFEEKPVTRTLVNAGVYALEPSALAALDGAGHCDMPALFERLRVQGQRTLVYPMHEPWLDVGKPEDYRAAQEALA